MRKILLIGILSCSLSTLLFSQQISVSGKVADENGSALPGVSIILKGTTVGTVSDASGNYSLNASATDVLVFSFIGYETQEVDVASRTRVDISLKESSEQLKEVVVIGYGEREKKDVTGAISQVNGDELVKNTQMNAQMAMQGKMAGVFVSSPGGTPWQRPTVRIRGVSTFGYAEPLYVIDGIPVLEGGASSTFPGDVDVRSPVDMMSSINPNDIESITVLKDASAAAIYGVRASNGVILITTKKGVAGRPKVEVSAQTGFQNIPKTFDMLNTGQYVSLYQEAYANNPIEAGNLPDEFNSGNAAYLGNSPTYDWQKELIHKNSPLQDYSLRVSGGNESTTYYISGGYGKSSGALIGNALERYTAAANISSKISKVFEAGMSMNLSYNNIDNNTSDNLPYVATAPPWQPIYDANDPTGYAPSQFIFYDPVPNPSFDPTSVNSGPLYNIVDSLSHPLWGPATRGNSIATINLHDHTYEVFRTLGSAYFAIHPLPGLSIKADINTDYYFNIRKDWEPHQTNIFSQTPGNIYAGNNGTSVGTYGERQSRNINLTREVTIDYNKNFGDHSIDLTLNGMAEKETWRSTDLSTAQVNSVDPDLRNVSNTPPYVQGFSFTRPQTLQGYFARVSYKYQSKYYLDATVRRDGSSRFAPGHRWGTFPSFAAAWRISSEDFFASSVRFINDLKIRVGWGELGNKETTQGFAYLSGVSNTSDFPKGSGNGDPYGTQYYGATLPNFANFDLSWERVRTSNAGFDAVLLNNHVNLTAEYYLRNTKGIIQSVQLPPNSGIQSATDINIGDVRNSGVELSLGYENTLGGLTYGVSGNLTTVKNRVIKLYRGNPFNYADPENGYAVDGNRRVQEGYPIGYFWGYDVGGVFQNQSEIDTYKGVYADNAGANDQQPGDMWFRDFNGDPAAGEIVNPVPDSIVNQNDYTYLGKSIPGFYYGLNVNLGMKGFDLSVFFQGVGDVQKYDAARAGGESMSSNGANQWTTTLNRWTPEHPSGTMPRAVRQDPNANTRYSSRWIEDAGYLRLKTVQLGYSLPASTLTKLGIVQSLRVYVTGTNLLTATKWLGIDPENDFDPPTRQYSVGVKATF